MKKYFTFTIVLLVQVSIIYGIYKWSTSGDEKPAAPQTAAKPEKEAQETPESTISEASPKAETISTTEDTNAPSLPLNYSKAITGNIASLPLSKAAKTGMLVDLKSREVLWNKKSKQPAPIASMTKMMTILLIMEELKSNPKITLDTMVQVTRESSHIGGSRVWLDPKEQFTIRELLKSMIVHSANDSTYLLAQYFADGDASAFVVKMNEKAKQLGLSASFTNTGGLPEKKASDENMGSAQDMVFLAEKLLKYPFVLENNKLKSIVFRPDSGKPLNLLNTNRLIRGDFPGVNGMKTGFTGRAGFCITATCDRNGKVLIAVVTGFKNGKERDKFVKQLLEWGYRQKAGLPNNLQKKSDSSAISDPKPSETEKTYTVKKGDTLNSISNAFYSSGSNWKKIYNANKDQLSTPNSLKEGMILKIPAL